MCYIEFWFICVDRSIIILQKVKAGLLGHVGRLMVERVFACLDEYCQQIKSVLGLLSADL